MQSIRINTNTRRTRTQGEVARLHFPSYSIVGVLTLTALQAKSIVLSRSIGGQRYFEVYVPHAITKEDGVLDLEVTRLTEFPVRSHNEARD